VVIDGCPPDLPLDLAAVQAALDRRRPGTSPLVSARREPDQAELVSGLFAGRTLGGPLTLLVRNADADPRAYALTADQLAAKKALKAAILAEKFKLRAQQKEKSSTPTRATRLLAHSNNKTAAKWPNANSTASSTTCMPMM
jgi:chorismate synthase